MPFLLDTNVCSWAIKAPPGAQILTLVMQYAGQLYASRITCAELYAYGYRTNAKHLQQIENLIDDLIVLEFDEECAREYGRIHARLAERGHQAGRADLMIAATSLVSGIPLTTYDRDFENIRNVISELRLEYWLST